MTKEERVIYNRKYREKNKEKIALSKKESYDKNKETPEYKEKKKNRNRRYRNKNKGQQKEYQKKYREKNKDKIKAYDKEHYSKIKDDPGFKLKRKEYHKEYYSKNKDKKKEYSINHKKDRNNRESDRYRKDPVYRTSRIISNVIRKSFKKSTKNRSTINILGCKFDEFKIYIESKFESWMTWDNHGLYNGEYNFGWDIDHIIPISTANTEDEIIKLNHYTNLQPLCSKINRDIKKDHV